MSAKITGLIWDAELSKDLKLVLLAYGDHADHEGRSIFPSVGLVAWKSGYSCRQIQRITAELVEMGILVDEGTSKLGTNQYHIDLDKLPKREPFSGGRLGRPSETGDTMTPISKKTGDTMTPISKKTGDAMSPISKETGDTLIKTGDISEETGDIAMSPEPSVNRQSFKPSEEKEREEISDRPNSLSLQAATKNLPSGIRASPEIQVFFETTGRYPSPDQVETVVDLIRSHGFTVEYLRVFWQEWRIARRYSPENLGWLNDWAVVGEIPFPGKPARRIPRPIKYDFQEKLSSESESSSLDATEPAPILEEKISGAQTTPLKAWDLVFSQLKQETIRSLFERIKNINLVNYLPDLDTFVVDAGSDETRALLEDRFAMILSRKLSGICNRNSKVIFISLEPIFE